MKYPSQLELSQSTDFDIESVLVPPGGSLRENFVYPSLFITFSFGMGILPSVFKKASGKSVISSTLPEKSLLVACTGLLLSLSLLCSSQVAFAQDGKKLVQQPSDAVVAEVPIEEAVDSKKGGKDPFAGIPKGGIIASYGTGGRTAQVSGLPITSISEDQQLPLTGSLRKASQDKWEVAITNNTEKSVSARLKLMQYSIGANGGRLLKTDYVSVILKPKGKESRKLTAMPQAKNASLVVMDYKAS